MLLLPPRGALLRPLLALAALAAAGVRAAEPPEALVVGAGIAGLCAAWELAQGGARVAVVDMASVFGGHAVMAEGVLNLTATPMQAAQGIRDTPELALRDFLTWGEDADPAWARRYVESSRPEIHDWLVGLGVDFDTFYDVAGNSVLRVHRTRGRGLALVSAIYREVVAHPRVDFVWNTRVDRLLARDGRIVGVAATQLRTGATLELRAGAVVLATGGFQSNLELVRAHWPAGLRFPSNLLIGGGINALGSGLELARAAGAELTRLDHQWNYVTGLPDPRFPGARRGLNAFNDRSLWVNATGRRFVAERGSHKFILPLLLDQPGATYWSIFDESIRREFYVSGSSWGDFREIERRIFGDPTLVKSAGTIAGLAAKAGLPAAALEETVRRYNAMVAGGVDEEFGRFGPGKPLQPVAVAQPPFYAVQFFPLTRKSMGGVAIDETCRVVDARRQPIPGLFAAGELTGLAGINGKAGLEGTFLGPSILTGRIAGRSVLAAAGRPSGARPPPPARAPAPLAPDPLATTALCLSCHDLPKLIATPREGFWHFEQVHRQVTAQNLACVTCHADLTVTYTPERHRFNRLAQIESCAACHKAAER